MSNRTLTVLVLISLAFNIAFLAGFIYKQSRIRSFLNPDGPKPNIPPERIEFFERMKHDMIPFREDFEKSKKDFVMELVNPDFNEEILNEKLDIILEKQIRMEHELGKRLIMLRKEMSPEEAHRFFAKHHFRNEKFKERLKKLRELK